MVEILLPILPGSQRVVDSARVKAHRGTSLHAVRYKTQPHQLLGDASRCGFRHTATFHLHLSHMHQAIEESARGEHYSFSLKSDAKGCLHTFHHAVFDNELGSAVLPLKKLWC